MPAVTRLADRCTGHGGFPPRPNDQGSPNVFVNGIPVHRQGDHWTTHCKSGCHDGILQTGSGKVFVNGKAIARIGDPITCGSVVAEGSDNVFAG